MIPYGRQEITEADISAVVDILQSDFVTQGPAVPAFEEAVAAYCGVPHAVAVNSATSALHIACLALGVGSGDIVWTSPISFVASANCALYCGAQVDFVDIDPRSCNISIDHLSTKLADAQRSGRLPKVVIAVHFAGQPCEMAEMAKLSQRYGFRIIEDASHALGGRFRQDRIGSCRHSDIAVFSFHAVKLITTGEGGMAVTTSSSLANSMRRLRTHGVTRREHELTRESEGPWYYEQVELGFNYRLTDIQAALGWSQLKRLDASIAKRHAIAERYDADLADVPLIRPWRNPADLSALHLYPVRVDRTRTLASRRAVFEALRRVGIGVNVHYIPIYRQPYFERLGFAAGHCPCAEEYYAAALTLPLFPGLTEGQQCEVVSALIGALATA